MRFYRYFDDLSFRSLRSDVYHYSWNSCFKDCFSGVTVALLTIPQSMAYALIANLPISCGIFAAIFSALIASLCGSSRHLILGPSNAVAILIQVAVSHIINLHYRDVSPSALDHISIQILMQLTFLIGTFQLFFALFKLGRFTQFVSYPVILGYLIGVASAVTVNQIYVFLGIFRDFSNHSTYASFINLFSNIVNVNVLTFVVGAFSFLLLTMLKKIDKRIPAGMITLVVASIVALLINELVEDGFMQIYGYDQLKSIPLVGDTGLFDELQLHFSFPSFDLAHINSLVSFAFAVSLLSILESTSVAKSVSNITGQKLSMNQEILGLSLGNFTSSFMGLMPISGSPSRTALNFDMGAQTRFSAIFCAITVALLVFIFEPFISKIPLSALAAIILYSVFRIVDLNQLKLCIKATRSDAIVLCVTALSCLIFNLDIAFYIGIFISVALYLKKVADPQVKEYQLDEKGTLHPITNQSNFAKKILFIKVEGELFFGAVDIFQSTLQSLMKKNYSTRVIILQLKNARDMDATSCLALQRLYDYLKESGRYLVICGISPAVWTVFQNAGLDLILGKENLFLTNESNLEAPMIRSMERARHLLKLEEDTFEAINVNALKFLTSEKKEELKVGEMT